MNKIHCTVWSESRKAFVVTHEKSATSGRPSSTLKLVSQAVSIGLLALSAGQAYATPSCTNPVTGAVTTTCSMIDDDTLTINAGGSISVTGAAGIIVGTGGTAAGTISNSGTVASSNNNAISVQTGAALGSITNNTGGTISGATSAGTAINLAASATVGDITNQGDMSGGNAINLQGNSSITGTLSNSGTITGTYQAAIRAQGSAGNDTLINTLSNSGAIVGTGSAVGVDLRGATTITSLVNNGTIAGDSGINLAGTAGNSKSMITTLTNIGSITGDTTAGVNVGSYGQITTINNATTGVISGSGYANTVHVGDGGGNAATISYLNNAGRLETSGGSAVYVGTGGQITLLTNSATGTISGLDAAAIEVTGNFATINNIINDGTLSNYSSTATGMNQSGIYVHGSYATVGEITNNGLVTATGVGLAVTSQSTIGGSTFSGNIVNSLGATIEGGNDGIDIVTSSTVSGSITNLGTISALAGTGIWIDGSTVTGDIINSGTITAQNSGGTAGGIALTNAAVGSVTNTGLITVSGTQASDAVGIGLYSGTSIVYSISNDGTISASATSGAAAYGIHIAGSGVGGNVVNSGNITAAATTGGNAYGISVSDTSTITGSISNSGTISASGALAHGMVVSNGSTVSGITNSGTIEIDATDPTSAGIAVLGGLSGGSSILGNIENSGTITGASNGIVVADSQVNGNIVNQTGGTISGRNTVGSAVGVSLSNSSITGSVVNMGTVTATGYSGESIGINVYNNSQIQGISNMGTITATNGSTAVAYGIKIQSSTLTGSINNSGTISGDNAAIFLQNGGVIQGGITNSGTIQNGIIVGTGSTVTGSIVNQSGGQIIGSGGVAISVFNNAQLGGITNNAGGTINGTMFIFGNGTNVTNNGLWILSEDPSQPNTYWPALITGNFAQGSTGVLRIGAYSTVSGRYSQVSVSGTASLGGTIDVDVKSGSPLARGDTLAQVITATGGVTGRFSSVTDNSQLFDFTALYTANDVSLTIAAGSSSGIADAVKNSGNKAGLGAANVLDEIITADPSGPIASPFQSLTSAQEVSNAVSQTLPVLSGATVWNTMSVLSSINKTIEARHLYNRGMSSGENFQGNQSVWMKPFGTWTNQANQNGAYGFRGQTGGVMIGGDSVVDNSTRLGLAVAWGNSYATSNAGVAPQNQTSNLYQLIGYGSYALSESVEANFQANGGWNNNTSNRYLQFANNTSAQGSYSSGVWHVGAGLAKTMALSDSTLVIPSTRFDYTWMKNQGYNETGSAGALALNVNSQTYQMSVLGADAKVVHKLTDHHSVNGNVGVGYNFSPTQTYVAGAFQGAPTLQFTTNGVNPGAVMGRAGVGYAYKVKENVDVGVRYDIDFQNAYTNQTASAKARWMF